MRGRAMHELLVGNTVAEMVAVFDLSTANRQEMWERGLAVIAYRKGMLQCLGTQLTADRQLAEDFENNLVGEDNGGVDAMSIVNGEIMRCEDILQAAKANNYAPLKAYACREMAELWKISRRADEDELLDAVSADHDWRLQNEWGIKQQKAIDQWKFWKAMAGVDQPEI